MKAASTRVVQCCCVVAILIVTPVAALGWRCGVCDGRRGAPMPGKEW